MPVFYFAWVNEGDVFDAAAHSVEDEKIFSIEISQSEGEFAQLTIEVLNPKIGLLAAGRNLWCWLSWDQGSGAEALFNGRLIGIPSRLQGEVVELKFLARPADYLAQRSALADSMRVLPWYDPVWLQAGDQDPNIVLETRAARWHIDRTTLEVTASSIVSGEAGTIDIATSEHFYDDFDVSYSETPLKSATISASVSWNQQGEADVDITPELIDAFRASGSSSGPPIVNSLTGDGLLSSWPKAGASLGGGWTVADSATVEDVSGRNAKAFYRNFATYDQSSIDAINQMIKDGVSASSIIWGRVPSHDYRFAAKVSSLKVFFPVHYTASRQRSESISATIVADIQNLIVDPDADDNVNIPVTSTTISEDIDLGGGIPIGDLRRNSYFKTDRGARSFEYLLLLGRATLLAKARAVEVTCKTTWGVASQVTCRHNVRVIDDRLPYGEAIGKVTSYKLSGSGDDAAFVAEIKIGCSIGRGTALAAAATGEPVYVDDDYVEDGYQQRAGAVTDLAESDLQYQSFDDFEVTDDDGVDLFNMTPDRVVKSIVVAGGMGDQRSAINRVKINLPSDIEKPLQDLPTTVTLELNPVDGSGFSVEFTPSVSLLVVPKTIDLEAP